MQHALSDLSFYLIRLLIVITFRLVWMAASFIAELLQKDKTDCYIKAHKQTTEFHNITLRTHIWTCWATPYIERREHSLCKTCYISQCHLFEILHGEFTLKWSKQRIISTSYSFVSDVGNIAPEQQPHNFHCRNHIQNANLPQHTTT